ncbi:uncharacterized protein LOC113506801 isoform X3 [Trichoplusia ni]|uniref:Uncharacterized protein LOC113506801 isoform X3 n=1 Tax=Trichoplusia ni TaxID=7111 RepID=A0A7E5WX77_TRINI|nr:uncharacterized protein LOC113506801 isoform X3 [Trichoplusia ni]
MTSWVIHLLLLPLQINLFVYNRSKNDFAGTAQKVEKKKKFIIVPMLVSFWTHLCLSQTYLFTGASESLGACSRMDGRGDGSQWWWQR